MTKLSTQPPLTANRLLAAAVYQIGEMMNTMMLMMSIMMMNLNAITKQKTAIVVLINGQKMVGCTSLTVAANVPTIGEVAELEAENLINN